MRRVLRVEFGIHVTDDSVGSMVTGLGAAGLVHQDHADPRCYIVEITRLAKFGHLKKELVRWEAYGFLRWREMSDPE